MLVTRKAEFSASHICRIPELDEAANRELFGNDANPNGHGHNYIVEATVEGEPDPVTGMVMDLKELKDILERQVVAPMDHRFLNHEVPPFDRVIPTTANVAREIWRRLDEPLSARQAKLCRVRLFETSDLYVDVFREDAGR
jgi:6-pyruvoyltetrahydropterin/6-carboxytetrahydropterin synthase